jgi:hypothetical protein
LPIILHPAWHRADVVHARNVRCVITAHAGILLTSSRSVGESAMGYAAGAYIYVQQPGRFGQVVTYCARPVTCLMALSCGSAW